MDYKRDHCSLCGKPKDQVSKLIVGLHGAVCSDCSRLCNDILENDKENPPKFPKPSHLREEVCLANIGLRRHGLVTAHSGNVSGRKGDQVLIKPSGVDYETLESRDIVEVSISTGEQTSGQLKPSVDLPHHLYLYRNMPEIGAVVHTHSNFATAFAACHKPIPCVLTAIADEFGGEIPCASYVDNEGDHIGEAILKHKTRAPAILLGNHGVFTWGASVADALKAAIMVEDVAKTALMAFQVGDPVTISGDEIEKWWDRYHNRYGQS